LRTPQSAQALYSTNGLKQVSWTNWI